MFRDTKQDSIKFFSFNGGIKIGIFFTSAKFRVFWTVVFALESKLVKILDSSFGNNEREGVHLYDIENVIIRRVTADNSGVGIKIANDRVETSFKGRFITTSGNYTAGLLLTSSNDKKFSLISLPEHKNNISDYLSIQNQ